MHVPKTRKPRRLGTGRKARRAGGGSAKRMFRFQRPQLADAKYARLKGPVLEDAPPPVLPPTPCGVLPPRMATTRASRGSGARRSRAPLRMPSPHCSEQRHDGARCRGDGGLDGFDVVVLRRGRCRGAELRERAAPRGRRPGTDGHYSSLNLRSVSLRVAVGAQSVHPLPQVVRR